MDKNFPEIIKKKPKFSAMNQMMSFSAFMLSSQFTANQLGIFFPQRCRFICRDSKPQNALLEAMTSSLSFLSRNKLLALSGLSLTLIKRLVGLERRNGFKHSLIILSQRHKFDQLKHMGCLTKPNHPTHPNTVWCVAFDTTGRFIATGNGDHTINVWDLHSDQRNPSRLQKLNGHTEAVRCLEFHPINKFTLVSGSRDHTIIVWEDAEDGKGFVSSKTLSGHCSCITAIQFFQNGNCLLSGSYDGTVKVWDISSVGNKTPPCIMSIPAHRHEVKMIRPHPDKPDCIITGGAEGYLMIIKIIMNPNGSVSSVNCICDVKNHERRITSVAMNCKTKMVVSASIDNTIGIRQICSDNRKLTSCQIKQLGENKMVVSMEFLDTIGGFLITCCEDFRSRIYKIAHDSTSFHLVGTIQFSCSIISVAVDPNGRYLAIGLDNGLTFLYS